MSAYSIATRGLAERKVPQGTLTPMGDLLFSASEPGAWYDPSDMSTLFQDSAGTTPVTAVEQPVGLMLDKSGRGNHALQATTTKRPVLSRRVNLLTKTENMVPTWVTGTAWTRGAFGNWTAPTNLGPTLAPDGSNNAVGIRSVGTGGVTTLVHRSSVFPSTTYKFTAQVRKVEGEDQTGLPGLRLLFQTGNNGVLVATVAASVVIGTSVSDSWQQFEISYTTPATGVNQVEVGLQFGSGASAAVAVWGGSLTRAADAHLPYQRVNTDTDYDADPAKFPAYLRFDGVDDALQTGNIDFTSTDKMTVWAGFTEFNTSVGILSEFSANAGSLPRSFYVAVKDSGGTTSFTARGDSTASIGRRFITGNLILAGAADLSIPGVVTRINSTSAGNTVIVGSTAPAFSNSSLYIGARAGTSLYFNGRLYGLIVRGAQSSLSQIEATEAYIKQKMRLP